MKEQLTKLVNYCLFIPGLGDNKQTADSIMCYLWPNYRFTLDLELLIFSWFLLDSLLSTWHYSIFIIKLFAHEYIFIYVSYIWPKGWTKWADIFWGNPWVPMSTLGDNIGKNLISFPKCFQNSMGNARHFS